MTPSDIERVARAMCIADGVDPDEGPGQIAFSLGDRRVAWEYREHVARAALAAMPPRDWPDMLPMSEAPRDGTEILAVRPGVRGEIIRSDLGFWIAQSDAFFEHMPDSEFLGWWPLPPLGSPQTAVDPRPPHDKAQPDKAPVSPLSGDPRRCWCHQCREERDAGNPLAFMGRTMIVCPTCGNKRCPRATDHHYACTGSNCSGQPGSIYQ